MASKKLSPTMRHAITFAQQHGGKLVRHPGGFWSCAEWVRYASGGSHESFSTGTADAIVTRGAGHYSEWKDGRNGRFPIAVTLGPAPSGGSER
jgi:hypothetical protein